MIRFTVPGASFRLVTEESWVKLRIACHVAMPWPMLIARSPAHRLRCTAVRTHVVGRGSIVTPNQRAAAAATSRCELTARIRRASRKPCDELVGHATPIRTTRSAPPCNRCDLPWASQARPRPRPRPPRQDVCAAPLHLGQAQLDRFASPQIAGP